MTPRGLLRCALAPFQWARVALWGTFGPAVERRPLVVVQGVVAGPEGWLLAERHDVRGWELPGGSVEPGESDGQALSREIREEVGIEVEVGERIGRYRRTGFRPHEARVYRCRLRSGAPRTSAESLAVAWFEPEGLPDTLLPWCRTPLEDARAGAQDVERNEHQGLARIAISMAIDLRMRARG